MTTPMQIERRALLGAAAALAGTAATGPLCARESSEPGATPPVKGPVVWLDMDRAELDAAYDQSRYAPHLAQITQRYRTNGEEVRSRLGAPMRFPYGPTSIEALDVYVTRQANAPINVFLHGGAWRVGLARDYAFAADVSAATLAASMSPGTLPREGRVVLQRPVRPQGRAPFHS